MIRVEITANKLDPVNHDVVIGSIIMKALKSAGVPVEASAFVLRGCPNGSLTYSSSGFKHSFVFVANGESTVNNQPFVRTHSRDGIEFFKSGQHLDDDEL